MAASVSISGVYYSLVRDFVVMVTGIELGLPDRAISGEVCAGRRFDVEIFQVSLMTLLNLSCGIPVESVPSSGSIRIRGILCHHIQYTCPAQCGRINRADSHS